MQPKKTMSMTNDQKTNTTTDGPFSEDTCTYVRGRELPGLEPPWRGWFGDIDVPPAKMVPGMDAIAPTTKYAIAGFTEDNQVWFYIL